jgi:hypothetical protein
MKCFRDEEAMNRRIRAGLGPTSKMAPVETTMSASEQPVRAQKKAKTTAEAIEKNASPCGTDDDVLDLDLTAREELEESLMTAARSATAKAAAAKTAASSSVLCPQTPPPTKTTRTKEIKPLLIRPSTVAGSLGPHVDQCAVESARRTTPSDSFPTILPISNLDDHVVYDVRDLKDTNWARPQVLYDKAIDMQRGIVCTTSGTYGGHMYGGHISTAHQRRDRKYNGLLVRDPGAHFGIVAFHYHVLIDAMRTRHKEASLCFLAEVEAGALCMYKMPAGVALSIDDLLEGKDWLLVFTTWGLIPAVVLFYYDIVVMFGTDEFKKAGLERRELYNMVARATVVAPEGSVRRALNKLALIVMDSKNELEHNLHDACYDFEEWLACEYIDLVDFACLVPPQSE